jgi:hypothetical protein
MLRVRNILPPVTTLLLMVALGVNIALVAPQPAQGQSSQAPNYSWKNVTIIAGGFITGIVPNPGFKNVMYVRTDIGGAYRFDPFTNKWTPLNDIFSATDWNLMGTESIAVDPVEPWRVYLGQGTYTQSWAGNGALLSSVDFGYTFHRTNLPIKLGANEAGRYSGERLAVDPQHHNILYLGSRNDGLWKSADFGHTWNQVTTFPITGPTNGVGLIFVKFWPTSQKPLKETIYVASSATDIPLYSSTDGGVTWQSVPNQPTGFYPTNGAIGPDGTFYVTYGDGTGADGMGGQRIGNGAVWKYVPSSGAWTNITPLGPWGNPALWYGFGAVAVDAQHPSTVMVTTLDRWWPGDEVYRSLDGGMTWIPLGLEPDTGVNYSNRNDSLSPYLNFGQGCTPTSCDPTLASFGWWLGSLAIDPFNSNHVLYGTGATIWASKDVTNVDSKQMTYWTVGAKGIEETSVGPLISPPTGAHLFSGVGDISGFRHDNFKVSPPGGMLLPIITATGLDFAQNNPSIIVRVGWASNAGAWSTDRGINWSLFLTSPAGVSGGPGTVAVSSDGSRFVWAPSNGTAAWSTDNGASWTPSTGLPANDPVISDRVNPMLFYSFDPASGTVYVSADGGTTFFAVATGLPNGGQLRATSHAQGDLWLATGSGLYHSTNSGVIFTKTRKVVSADAVGFRQAASGSTYPAVFISGKVNNVVGIFRSTDAGATWVRINDAHHQWGWIGTVIGDPRVFGRVYLGTNGRGIIYGDSTSGK